MDSQSSGPISVGFVGLGRMGVPMAQHLVAAGFDVTVYNRTAARASEFAAAHLCRSVRTPRELADGLLDRGHHGCRRARTRCDARR